MAISKKLLLIATLTCNVPVNTTTHSDTIQLKIVIEKENNTIIQDEQNNKNDAVIQKKQEQEKKRKRQFYKDVALILSFHVAFYALWIGLDYYLSVPNHYTPSVPEWRKEKPLFTV